jgi:enoyl-CoA hydratase/carnithine racemase
MTLIRHERQGRILILRLDKARGNAIDEPLIEELLAATAAVASDGGVAGVLLASSHPKLFCPGLDLVGLFEYDRPRMERFMLRFGEAMGALYALPKPVVAAVSGHAVAGGCILAMTADWRVLSRGAQIGLNEVKVGVPLPWSVATLLRATTPASALAKVALLGRNFEGEEALAAGLAEELAEPMGFEAVCLARLAEFVDKDAYAFARTKSYLRGDAIREMRSRERELMGEWLDGWFSEGTRARIRAIVQSITRS